jgi:hypothetical protein
MHRRESYHSGVRRDRWPSQRIAERIKRNVSREDTTRLEDRIVLIQNLTVARTRNERPTRGDFDLAVTEADIITPRSIKQFVASYPNRREKGVGGVIYQTVPKFKETSAAAARDNLIEWIIRVK